ncbi:MAG: amidohydrolase, partial [Thermodesulfobacteriota bacterium]
MDLTAKEALKEKIRRIIDREGARIIQIGEEVAAHPELGYQERRTAALAAEFLRKTGLPCETGLALTGVKAQLTGRAAGPTLALIGEMDALVTPDHPRADPVSKAAHSCGHNAQIAGLLGAALGLAESGAMNHLDGAVVFLAVPAEEYVDLDFRQDLARQGRVHFLGGKPELIRLGCFDDVDLAVMIHTHATPEYRIAAVTASSNGFLVKKVRFVGRSAHAGVAPHQGVNALNAAHVAQAAIHAQRETFPDADFIRVHFIITRGGDSINAVPAEVRMEIQVRGRTTSALLAAADKVDRALKAGALAVGAGVEIETLPGYLPLRNDPGLKCLFRENAAILFGENEFTDAPHRGGGTDRGDVSQIMPALHPYLAGARGSAHGGDWVIENPELAYLAPAKLLAMMAVDLLWDGAAAARSVLAEHRPALTKAQYLDLLAGWTSREWYDG